MKNFVVRTPVFPFSYLQSLYESDDCISFIFGFFASNAIFQESIYLYSIEVYNLAFDVLNHPDHDKKKIKTGITLIKYYSRMCYRSTPFGVAAGITPGHFGAGPVNTTVTYSKKACKTDGGVLFQITDILKRIPEMQANLIFYPNNTSHCSGQNIRLFERTYDFKTGSFDFKLSKIEESYYLSEIVKRSEHGVTLKTLGEYLEKEKFPARDIEDFLYNLIQVDILTADLQYHYNDPDFDEKLGVLIHRNFGFSSGGEIRQIEERLSRTVRLKKSYTGSTGMTSINLLKQLDELLSPYNNQKQDRSSIQVDLIGTSVISLPEKTGEQLRSQLPLISRISKKNFFSSEIEEFKKKFVEKYDLRILPLLDVLDSDTGTGFPVHDGGTKIPYLLKGIKWVPKSDKQSVTFSTRDEFLHKRYKQFILEGASQLSLSETDVVHLQDITDKTGSVSHSSLTATFQLLAGTVEDMERGDYFINLTDLKSKSGIDTLSRFAYASPAISSICKEIFEIETSSQGTDEMLVQIYHLAQPRLSNILSHPDFCQFRIPVYDFDKSDDSIISVELKDLYICVRNDEVILLSKVHKKRVIPCLLHAHNFTFLTSPIYRFLCMLQQGDFLTVWDWGFLETERYLPRVVFRNFILSRARWILKREDIITNEKNAKFQLKAFLEKNHVDRYVTLVNGDNILPLNLSHEICMDILMKELKSQGHILLEENLYAQSDHTLIKTGFGNVTNEFHYTFGTEVNRTARVSLNGKEITKIFESAGNEPSAFSRKLIPGEECAYLKIYTSFYNIEKLLTYQLPVVIKRLAGKNIITSFFFVRYFDTDVHLRLRFFSKPVHLNKILKEVRRALSADIEEGTISRIVVDTYERELDRYGGTPAAMEISEKLFFFDSQCVLKLLALVHGSSGEEQKWIYALAGVDYLLRDFGGDVSSYESFFDRLADYYLSRLQSRKDTQLAIKTFFRSQRKTIENYLSGSVTDGVFEVFEERSRCIREELRNREKGYATDNLNVESFIHMFLNRFFESEQNSQEAIVYYLLYLYYRSKAKRTDKAVIPTAL